MMTQPTCTYCTYQLDDTNGVCLMVTRVGVHAKRLSHPQGLIGVWGADQFVRTLARRHANPLGDNKCKIFIKSFFRKFSDFESLTTIIFWKKLRNILIFAGLELVMVPNGELHITSVDYRHTHHPYFCIVRNIDTGISKESLPFHLTVRGIYLYSEQIKGYCKRWQKNQLTGCQETFCLISLRLDIWIKEKKT